MDIFSSEFYQNIITFDVSIRVSVWFIHRALYAHPAFQVFSAISGTTIPSSNVAKLFVGCVYIEYTFMINNLYSIAYIVDSEELLLRKITFLDFLKTQFFQ